MGIAMLPFFVSDPDFYAYNRSITQRLFKYITTGEGDPPIHQLNHLLCLSNSTK